MDKSNWRPGASSSAVGDTTMESDDWRAQLHPDLRQLIADKIADTFKSHAPSSRHEELTERAVSFEMLNYIAATSQSDYIQETSLKTMKKVTPSWIPIASTTQTSNPNGGDQKGASDAFRDPMLESSDWRAQLEADSRQILVNKITDTLKRCLPFSGGEELQDIAVWFEEKTYTAATSQSDYLRKLSSKMLAIDSMQSESAANSVNHWVPLDSTDQTNNPNGGDWKEEVYQKINAMKDLYLLDLNVMHQKALSKLLQHDSRQQPESERLEKLIKYTHMLECCMQFLQTPKHGILATHKENLDTYEKAITNVINLNKRNPQQQAQALPPPHMQSLQQLEPTHSQFTQVQSHENQMNIYILNSMQPSLIIDAGQNSNMNFLQQVSIGSLQQNVVSGPHVPNN